MRQKTFGVRSMLGDFKGKKVLVAGLGLLGGGVAATKWLVRHGARVTVTDLKTRSELKTSIRALRAEAGKIKFVLGRHRLLDFKSNEIIVVNPAVPRESRYLKAARAAGVRFENEASIFFAFCKNPIVGVTGTRGKTTTANWTHHFLRQKHPRAVLTGNSSESPMLGVLDNLDGRSPVVVELSSWHLELLPVSKLAPRVAVITNVYPDHLNRYASLKSYASAKANIFRHQEKDDCLILNRKNRWSVFFTGRKPKSKIIYFPKDLGVNRKLFEGMYGAHNFLNLSAAIIAAGIFGVSVREARRALKSLPGVKFREEIIYSKKKLKIVNDSTATSPDATIAALRRFDKQGELILIAGGTDKNLPFKEWAKAVKKYVKPRNLFLLGGSATKKIVKELRKISYFKKFKPQVFESLPFILRAVRGLLKTKNHKLSTILFSPGAASFEKFKNEFDRGEKFSRYSKKIFRARSGGA